MSSITKQQRDFFIACAIGDGHITKGGTLIICGTKEGRKLAQVLDSVIIPSFKYKLSK